MLVGLLAAPAWAQPIYVDQNAGGAATGANWTDALPSLQAALTLGRATGQREIRIADGIYRPDAGLDRAAAFRLNRDGFQLRGGYAGSGAPNPDDRDSSVYVTVLSGDLAGNDGPGFVNNTENSFHVVILEFGFTGTLDGLTVAGGRASGAGNDNRGGGLQAQANTTLFAHDVRFVGNDATSQGGGVFLFRCVVQMTECVFVGNRASNAGGGLFFFDDLGNKRVERCSFLGNTAGSGGGGGLGGATGNLLCVNSVFTGNFAGASGTAGVGGGAGVSGGTPTFANCTFAGNTTSGQSGAGLAVTASSPVPNIFNCIFWKNADSLARDENAQIGRVFAATPAPNVRSTLIEGLSAFAGNGNLDGDPNFADLEGGDGLTGTEDDDVRLMDASAAVDAGDDLLIPAGVSTDRDGNDRVQCGAVDMGAYESGAGGGGVAIACPDDVELECGSTGPEHAGFASASDACSGATPAVAYSDSSQIVACAEPGAAVEIITRTWYVVDQPEITCSQTITVVDTSPPTLECPPDIDVELETGSCAASGLSLGAPVATDCSATTVTNDAPAEFPPGATIVTWTATDACGSTTTCEQVITVSDAQLPFLQSQVEKAMLWPPNHALIDVGLTVTVDDNCDSGLPPVVTVYANEDDDEDTGDGNHSPDAAGALQLRAERSGDGQGRVYLIVVTAEDAAGNIGTSTAVVTVPHDRSKKSLNKVSSLAAQAQAYFQTFGVIPPGYFEIGDGPELP